MPRLRGEGLLIGHTKEGSVTHRVRSATWFYKNQRQGNSEKKRTKGTIDVGERLQARRLLWGAGHSREKINGGS